MRVALWFLVVVLATPVWYENSVVDLPCVNKRVALTHNPFLQLSMARLLVPGVALQEANSELIECNALSFLTPSSCFFRFSASYCMQSHGVCFCLV